MGVYMKSIINRILIFSIIFISSLIIDKKNQNNIFSKTNFKNHLNEHINVLKMVDLYNGVFDSFVEIDENVSVSYSLLDTIDKKPYHNGIKVFSNDYYVLSLEDGLVVNKGKNDLIGKYISILTINDRIITYGNLDSIEIKLYELVKKDDLIGISKLDNKVYCYYIEMKEKEYLDVMKMIN